MDLYSAWPLTPPPSWGPTLTGASHVTVTANSTFTCIWIDCSSTWLTQGNSSHEMTQSALWSTNWPTIFDMTKALICCSRCSNDLHTSTYSSSCSWLCGLPFRRSGSVYKSISFLRPADHAAGGSARAAHALQLCGVQNQRKCSMASSFNTM